MKSSNETPTSRDLLCCIVFCSFLKRFKEKNRLNSMTCEIAIEVIFLQNEEALPTFFLLHI